MGSTPTPGSSSSSTSGVPSRAQASPSFCFSVEGEVLQHAEILVEAELLGHVAEALTQQIPLAHWIQPQHPDGARFGDQQTGQQA